MKLTQILIIVIIVSLGIFSVNQTLNYFYKSEFLQTPCELCKELNPHLKECFKSGSIINPSREYKKLNISEDLFTDLNT